MEPTKPSGHEPPSDSPHEQDNRILKQAEPPENTAEPGEAEGSPVEIPPPPDEEPSHEIPEAVMVRQRRLSFVWLLPLIALIIGGWLVYKNFIEKDIEIRIRFASGAGLMAGKTQVKHKGVMVGEIKKLGLGDDLKSVIATVNISRSAAAALKTETQFWVVEPRISLLGISGLDTLVSGSYVEMRPGGGDPCYEFTALPSPPPISETEPGLHLVLKTANLGSIRPGSPVLYRKVTVGSVQSYDFNKDNSGVDIRIHIQSPYAHLVTPCSRFWNSSGITLSGDLGGLTFQAESLASIVAGGISFFNPSQEEHKNLKQCSNGDTFVLFDDYKSADAGIPVRIRFESARGLVPDKTKVFYKGIEVGVLKSIDINKDLKGVTGVFLFVPSSEPALNDSTRFWTVKPRLSFTEISGLDTLLSGIYLEMTFELGGQPRRDFEVLKDPPPRLDQSTGLNIILASDDLGSISRGTSVFYKKMKVGSVLAFHLSRSRKTILIDVNIEEPYTFLVRSNSKFWNSSGVSVKGNINGVDVRTESLESILYGGIAFHTPDEGGRAIVDGHEFRLYKDYESARENGLPISIRFSIGHGLKKGSQVRFRDVQVGTVTRVRPDRDMSSVVVDVMLTRESEELAVSGTQFWVVKPKLGIVETSNLDTLISGNYIAVIPGQGESQTEFRGAEEPPSSLIVNSEDLSLTLTASRLGSLKKGIPVYYREVQVGQVTGYRLADSSDKVLVTVAIKSAFAPLVHRNTRFWNVSGVDFDFGFFRGMRFQMNTVESLIEGGIAFATPPPDDMGERAKNNDTFVLHDRAEKTWLGWAPAISLDQDR